VKTSIARKALLAAAGIGVALLLGWLVTTQGPLAPARVTVAAAQKGPLTASTFGIGTVEARRSYALGPTVASRVLRVLVDHGDTVEAGQLLAELDPVDLEDRVRSGQMTVERTANTVLAARAQVAEAQSRAALATANADRIADLAAKGFFSKEAADARAHEARAARSAVDATQALLAAAQRDREKALSDLAGLGRVRAQARLLSPAKGVISARLVEPGSTVVAGQAVVQMIDPASLWVRARIDQGQAGGVRVGQPARIVLRSDPGSVHLGEVQRVDWVSDAVTEERIVNVGFAASAGPASVGELVEVTIVVSELPDALFVPTAAIKREDRRDGVWRVRNGRLVFQPVQLGIATQDGRSQVVAGLAPGDEIVVHSERALKADAKVKIVDTLGRDGS